MLVFQDNTSISIIPTPQLPTCGSARFRWQMDTALPYVLPNINCIDEGFYRDGYRFNASFRNDLDRMIIFHGVAAEVPRVFLVPKSDKMGPNFATPGGHRIPLLSVVTFTGADEYTTPGAAFQDADKKILACFDYLSDYLAALQRSLPYSVTWTLYPVSLFDAGIVHHSVWHLCKDQQWKLLRAGCGFASSTSRQLRAPAFQTDLHRSNFPPELDLANELLAEAHVAIYRRLPRLTVVNSFTALETLANAVYKRLKVQQLIGSGLKESSAELTAEGLRKKNRNNEKFLLHSGIKEATGRSLEVEDQALYVRCLELEAKVRHRVIHRGEIPSIQDAKECYLTCCRIVQWLCVLAGFPKKEMDIGPGESTWTFEVGGIREPHVSTSSEREALLRMIHWPRADFQPTEPDPPPPEFVFRFGGPRLKANMLDNKCKPQDASAPPTLASMPPPDRGK